MRKLVRVTKIKERKDAEVPHNIQEGAIYIGQFTNEPKIGDRFTILPISFGKYNQQGLSTSLVQEIKDDSTFTTYNSIYKWELIDSTENDKD